MLFKKIIVMGFLFLPTLAHAETSNITTINSSLNFQSTDKNCGIGNSDLLVGMEQGEPKLHTFIAINNPQTVDPQIVTELFIEIGDKNFHITKPQFIKNKWVFVQSIEEADTDSNLLSKILDVGHIHYTLIANKNTIFDKIDTFNNVDSQEVKDKLMECALRLSSQEVFKNLPQ